MSGTTETPIPLLPEPDHEVESGRRIHPVGSPEKDVQAKSILSAPMHKIDESITGLIKRRTDKLFDDFDKKVASDDPIGSGLPDMKNANSSQIYNSDNESFFDDLKLILSEFTPPIISNIFDALARRNASANDEHSAFRRVLNATLPARLRILVLRLLTTTTIYDLEVDKKEAEEGQTGSAYTGTTTDGTTAGQPATTQTDALQVPKKTSSSSAPSTTTPAQKNVPVRK